MMVTMSHVLKALLLSGALLLVACSAKESVFIPAPQTDEQDSVVYVYRPSSSTNFMMSPKVVLDGNEKFKISSGDYRYVYLQPGSHTIGLNPTDQYQTREGIELNTEAGKSYYLRVKTSLKFEADKMNTRTFWIETVDEKTAQDEISKTDYSGPLAQEATAQPAADKEGFSVDKTQDPFADKK
jgi:hypothetical protein